MNEDYEYVALYRIKEQFKKHCSDEDKVLFVEAVISATNQKRMMRENGVEVFNSKKELCRSINYLLMENDCWIKEGLEKESKNINIKKHIWEEWEFKIIDTVIPNNTRINNILMKNKKLFSFRENSIFNMFNTYAILFEGGRYDGDIMTKMPRFPKKFKEIVDKYLQENYAPY